MKLHGKIGYWLFAIALVAMADLQPLAAQSGTAPAATAPAATGEAPAESVAIPLGKSGLEISPPNQWQTKQPRSRIVEHEFSIASGDEATPDVRITIMQAGGGIEANVKRWIGQFSQPDGTPTKAVREKKTIADHEVYTVDIAGTFKDQPRGPMGPSTNRQDYRMLGAIIKTDSGNFFVKMYGNKNLIANAEDSFGTFLASLSNSKEDK